MSELYALKDVKLGKFYPPTVYNNVDDAKRSIKDLLQYAPESMLSRHPEDFDLYLLATYDEESGNVDWLYDDLNQPIINKYILTCNQLVTSKPELKVVQNVN